VYTARVYTVRSRPWREGAQVTLATCETGLSMTHPGDFGHDGVALQCSRGSPRVTVSREEGPDDALGLSVRFGYTAPPRISLGVAI
jgi:hypothetical protein